MSTGRSIHGESRARVRRKERKRERDTHSPSSRAQPVNTASNWQKLSKSTITREIGKSAGGRKADWRERKMYGEREEGKKEIGCVLVHV